MMKMEKVIVPLVVISMMLSLTACGDNNLAETGITITFSAIDLNSGTNNEGDYADEIIRDIEDYTGVNLKLEWYRDDELSEKNNLALASPSTMPQIMTWSGTITGDVVSAAKNGAFINLNDYIWDSEKYPNLSALSKDIADELTVDGKLIAIPRLRVVGRYGLSYRKDWAQKLGVELPQNATPDDVYDMLYAFTYADPDGNGIDDTVGLEMTSYTGTFDIIQTWFGCGNGWQLEDGELVPVWTTDEYFEAVEYIKRLYDDGLMAKDFYSRPSSSLSDGCKNGENGVYIDVLDAGKRIWQYFENPDTYTPSVVNPDEPASMVLYGAVNGHTLGTAGYNGYFTLSATTLDTQDKIEAALTLLDKLNDSQMLILTQYGIEGINYEIKDGYLIDTDTKDTKLSNNYLGLNQLLTFLPSIEQEESLIPLEKDKFEQAQTEAYTEALEYAQVNPALPYLVNSGAYSTSGALLDDKVTSLRTQYICGEIDLEAFKASLEEIRKQGYDDIITEVNEQYKR